MRDGVASFNPTEPPALSRIAQRRHARLPRQRVGGGGDLTLSGLGAQDGMRTTALRVMRSATVPLRNSGAGPRAHQKPPTVLPIHSTRRAWG